MAEREDSKINWITCPDCGAKIGIVVSVGKAPVPTITAPITPQHQVATILPTGDIEEKLVAAGVDLTLVDVEEDDEIVIVSPKRFLGDLWGSVNESIRSIGGGWIRDGRSSRWEIRKEELG